MDETQEDYENDDDDYDDENGTPLSTGTKVSAFGVILGGLLVAVGVGSYAASGFASETALIPAVFGLVIAAFGTLGWRTERERVGVGGVGILAILGAAGSTRGLPDFVTLVSGGTVRRPLAAVSQGLMFVVCVLLLLAVVWYVVDERM